MTQLLFVINNIGSFSSASSCCSWFYRIPKREKFPSVQQLHIYMHPISRKNSKVDPYGRRRAAWVFDSISHFTIRSHIMDFKQFYKQRKKLSHVFRIKCQRFVRVCRHVYIFHFFSVSVCVCVRVRKIMNVCVCRQSATWVSADVCVRGTLISIRNWRSITIVLKTVIRKYSYAMVCMSMITMMMGTLHLFLYCVNTSGKKSYRGHYYGDGIFGPVIPLITGLIGLKVERLSLKPWFQWFHSSSRINYIIWSIWYGPNLKS